MNFEVSTFNRHINIILTYVLSKSRGQAQFHYEYLVNYDRYSEHYNFHQIGTSICSIDCNI